jgi:hypothetical protein
MPFINGTYYMNPAYGRVIENARAFEPPPRPIAANQQRTTASRWVTIQGRHVLITYGQNEHLSDSLGDEIANTAKKYEGSTDWAFAKRKDNFPANTNKCNKFVYDVTNEAGARATVIGRDGKSRPPLAGEWADPKTKIANWSVLGNNQIPQPGDVAAYKIPGNASYTGHSGIVTSVDPNGTVHAIAAHGDIVGPDDKFNSSLGRAVKYRRYEGAR